ncbi:hypothetical protein L3Q72_06370 [Vibrio sp. JC009]|uniref:hypothetical protein n=1 Tax=Vibrio sp. JC009 TaxID=2912314 RepID=UPI0023AFDFB6|nr:hypothetical protein [Vibrio sp. JC009]WED23015.1 hypothetical protein L3Q72_06370 [Vibrio sp. JC009]
MKIKHLLPAALVTTASLTWLIACSSTAQSVGDSQVGTIKSEQISEASGLVASSVNKGILWVNNDSFSQNALFAINERGEHLATLKISGIQNIDWEDLATFEFQGIRYILIADTGNNAVDRENYKLHFIREPELKRLSRSEQSIVAAKPEWTITFTYEDGLKDCEAVAVDIVNKKILLLSKRDTPPALYELDLSQRTPQVATKLGDITPFPLPKELRFGMLDLLNISSMPTAMDISPDGKRLMVLTYSAAYLYSNENQSSWLDVFSTKPEIIEFPQLEQAEAAGFGANGESIYITTEKVPAPLLKY